MRIAAIIAWMVALFFAMAPAVAEKRVALVIGNGDYKTAGTLANPANDAAGMSALLMGAGFEVIERKNVGIIEMRRAIGEFSDAARYADIAVVYYSGHGIEVDGVNYLVPIDAVMERDVDVPFEAYSLDNLLRGLEPVKRLRLVMLDACRDNPFVRTMKRTAGTRAIGRGLAAVEPTSVNTLIGYAAKAGSYALDGEGSNSPYATALLTHLQTPGLDLRLAFGRVRDEVMKSTKNRQEPFVYGSLGGSNVSLIESTGATNAGPPPPPQAPVLSLDRAAQAWAVTQNTTSIAVLEDFIRQFGSTPYGSMARARLDELKKKDAAAAAPPAPPSVSPPAPGPTNDAAERAWAATQNTTSIAVLETFIARFPGTFYADLARARMEELKKAQVAVATPTPPVAPKVPEKATSDSRSVQPGQRDAKGCGNIAGTWGWFTGNEAVFRPNGTNQSGDGGVTGNWKCVEGVFIVTWSNGFTDRLTLSSDGKRLAGTNNWGFAVSATRRATASPGTSREAPTAQQAPSQQAPSQQQDQNGGSIGGLIGGVLRGAGDLVGGILGDNKSQNTKP